MSHNHFGFVNKSYKQRKFEDNRKNEIRDRANIETINRYKVKTSPQLGPRNIFYHYVFDLNWSLKDAIYKIIKQFPNLDEEVVRKWLEEKETRKKEEDQKHEGR